MTLRVHDILLNVRLRIVLGALTALSPALASIVAQSPTLPVQPDSAHHLAPIVVSRGRLSPGGGSAAARVDVLAVSTIGTESAGILPMLAAAPGVTFSNDQGNRAQPSLQLRGFTLSPVSGLPQGISVYLDGIRINEPDAQEVHFDLIPSEAIERAEITRGPSALFGRNTLGGVLNLTTRRAEANSIEAETAAGSYGQRELHLTAMGKSGDFDALLLGVGSREDGYQAQSGTRVGQLFATVGRRTTDGDVALSVLLAHDALFEAGSLPESLYIASPRANYTAGDVFRPRLSHISLRANRQSALGTLRGALFSRRNAIEQFNANADAANTRAFVTNASLGGTLELEHHFGVFGHDVAAIGGGEVSRERVSYRVLQEATDTHAVDDDCTLITTDSGECERAQVNGLSSAAFVQVAAVLTEHLTLTASARGDAMHVPIRDFRDPSNDGDNTFRNVSPRLAIGFTPAPNVSGYASVGSGFRAPAPLELACASPDAACPLPFSLGADPPLAPVVAWNEEAGIAWSGSREASLTLSLFDTDVHDDIVFVSSSRAAGYYQNIARTRRRGAEGAFGSPEVGGLHVFGSYSFVKSTYESTAQLASALPGNVVTPGDRFPLSPEHRVQIGSAFHHGSGSTTLDVSLQTHVNSSQYLRGDDANRMAPIPASAVTDLRLSCQRGSVQTDIRLANLFDHHYAAFGTFAQNAASGRLERFLTPAYARTVSVSFAIRD